MHTHHYYHSMIYFLHGHKRLSELYSVMGIRGFAISMVQLFLPIYIYLLRNSIADVLLFFLFTCLSLIIFFPLAGYIASRVGNMHMALISAPLGIIFFMAIYFFNPLEIGLIPLGILLGAFDSFFWVFFHGDFSKFSDKKIISKEVGGWRLFYGAAHIVGPFVGGAIIAFFSFHILFLLVAILLLIAPFPLLFTKDVKQKTKFSFNELFSREHLRSAPAYIGHGAAVGSTMMVWPLFLFFIIPDFFEIGSMSLAINILNILVVVLVGLYAARIGKKRLVRLGGLLFGISIAVRAFVRLPIQAFAAWAFGGISFPMAIIPMEGMTYSRAKRENIMELFSFREWMLSIGRMLMIAILFFALIYAPDLAGAFTYTLLAGGLLSMLMGTMK